MRYCRRCGRILADQARFCPGCGLPVQMQAEEGFFSYSALRKKNRQKKIIISVIVTVCLLVSAGIGGFFIFRTRKQDPYAQNIAMAEKYLLEEDYDRAEEYYAKASQIEPKKAEPYEKLYEIYTATDQEEKAQEVEKKASEELSEEHQQAFEEKKGEIQEVYQPVNSYTVLADLPDQEITPISINREVWLVKENGEYAFMDSQGKKVSDYTTENAHIRLKKADTSAERSMNACIATRANLVTDGNQWPNQLGGPSLCRIEEEKGPHLEIVLDEQQNRTLSADSEKSYAEAKIQAPVITEPYYLKKEGDQSGSYSVFNPGNGVLYGPYSKEETAGFGVLLDQLTDLGFVSSETGWFKQVLYGPFWSRNQEKTEHPIVLHSSDGTKELDDFDEALIVDSQSIGTLKKERFALYDSTLQELYTGYFEKGAVPINGNAPVKIQGKWKLVQLGEPQKDPSALSRRAASTKSETGQEKKDQQALPDEQQGNTAQASDAAQIDQNSAADKPQGNAASTENAGNGTGKKEEEQSGQSKPGSMNEDASASDLDPKKEQEILELISGEYLGSAADSRLLFKINDDKTFVAFRGCLIAQETASSEGLYFTSLIRGKFRLKKGPSPNIYQAEILSSVPTVEKGTVKWIGKTRVEYEGDGGLNPGKILTIYLPGTKTADLPEGYQGWYESVTSSGKEAQKESISSDQKTKTDQAEENKESLTKTDRPVFVSEGMMYCRISSPENLKQTKQKQAK